MVNKNKRKQVTPEEILARPWCYYCERDFDDLKILINHQKAKHYKCDKCGRRLNTAGGLSVHMTQVHKESLTQIENALPDRADLSQEIFGMEGIPEDKKRSHEQRVLEAFAKAEHDRRQSTGNPPPGSGEGGAKKPKLEGVSDLKKRLAEHKAKKAAEEAAGAAAPAQEGGNTPMGADESMQSPGSLGAYESFEQPPGFPPQQAPQYQFGPPSQPYQNSQGQFGPGPQQYPPPVSSPPSFAPPGQAFSPPGMPQYPNQQFAPPQQYGGPPQFQQGPPQFQNGPPPQFGPGPPQFQQVPPPPQFHHNGLPYQNGPPQQFGPGSPGPYVPNQFQPPPQHNTPPQFNIMPNRPASLPPPPGGLPQRPVAGPPQVNLQQLQQMHQGQNPSNVAGPKATQNPFGMSLSPHNATPPQDGLVLPATPVTQAEPEKLEEKVVTPVKEAKKPKKSEGKAKLVYSDNEFSPEEKLAKLSRYAFSPAVAA